jgi:hypothetical protein
MNNRAKVNAKVASAKINMYCKVCADAGKPREVVSSHNVRDATGANSCPTLAEQQCKYCKKPGHTVKFCKELEEKNKVRSKNLSQCEKQIVSTQSVLKPASAPVAAKNGFAALCSDSESGEETDDAEHDSPNCCAKKENAEERNFPPLKGWKNVTSLLPFATGINLNFAAALQTPATNKTKPVKATPSAPVKAAAPVKAREIQPIVLKGKWADEESSDEEDEDEDDVPVQAPAQAQAQTPAQAPVQVQTTCAW